MRSLITVQLGGYANYVGAHFWNMQARLTPALAAAPRASLSHAPALSRSAQDDAAGWADTHDGAASPFAELDSGVLYRAGGTAKARLRTCMCPCAGRDG